MMEVASGCAAGVMIGFYYEVFMAVIKGFKRVPKNRLGVHPTSTVWEYIEFDAHGARILQLSTGGFDARKSPGKVSQTLQLDARAARRLHEILKSDVPDLDGR
jgi:hypothetical protein